MWIEVGNESARVPRRTADGVRFRAAPGKRVTRLRMPDDWDDDRIVTQAVAALALHLQPTTAPVWIDSDRDEVRKRLCHHYDLDARYKRPDPDEWQAELDSLGPLGERD